VKSHSSNFVIAIQYTLGDAGGPQLISRDANPAPGKQKVRPGGGVKRIAEEVQCNELEVEKRRHSQADPPRTVSPIVLVTLVHSDKAAHKGVTALALKTMLPILEWRVCICIVEKNVEMTTAYPSGAA
jgi:hypothetical protein